MREEVWTERRCSFLMFSKKSHTLLQYWCLPDQRCAVPAENPNSKATSATDTGSRDARNLIPAVASTSSSTHLSFCRGPEVGPFCYALSSGLFLSWTVVRQTFRCLPCYSGPCCLTECTLM